MPSLRHCIISTDCFIGVNHQGGWDGFTHQPPHLPTCMYVSLCVYQPISNLSVYIDHIKTNSKEDRFGNNACVHPPHVCTFAHVLVHEERLHLVAFLDCT